MKETFFAKYIIPIAGLGLLLGVALTVVFAIYG
jgi:hypothetical protein